MVSAGGAIGVLWVPLGLSRFVVTVLHSFNSWVNDHFGRRIGFWSAGVITIIGVVILSASENIGGFIV
jgi:hypothetical protein